MKTDFYTKTVLTVIAVCLIALTLHTYSFVPLAKAAGPAMEHYAMLPANKDGSVNVRLSKQDTLRVNVVQISNQKIQYPLQTVISNEHAIDVNIPHKLDVDIASAPELNVKIDDCSSGALSLSGPIEVTQSK